MKNIQVIYLMRFLTLKGLWKENNQKVLAQEDEYLKPSVIKKTIFYILEIKIE